MPIGRLHRLRLITEVVPELLHGEKLLGGRDFDKIMADKIISQEPDYEEKEGLPMILSAMVLS